MWNASCRIGMFAAVAWASTTNAQLTPEWTTVIQPSGFSTVFDVVTASDGATFLATTIDFSLVELTRLSSDGSVAWTQIFNTSSQDDARALAITDDEAYVYLLASSGRSVTSSDYAVIKYDASTGSELWITYLDGGDRGIDTPADIAVMADGGCVVTGGFDTPNEQRDFGTARLDANGNEIWRRYFTGFGSFLFENDDAELIIVDPNGDIVVSGSAMAGSDSDIVTIKYDGATGATIWEASYEGFGNDVADDIGVLSNGDVVVFGIDSLTSGPRWVLSCYDGATGSENWSLIYDRGVEQQARDLAIASDGTVFATGLFDPTTQISGDSQLSAIAVDSATGNLVWEASFGDPGTGNGEYGSWIYPDENGSVWIAGGTSSDSIVGPLEEDGLLLQLNENNGNVQSVSLLNTSTMSQTEREALRFGGVDAAGNAYVVGRVDGSGISIVSAKYSLAGCVADTNGDGQLTPADFNAWIQAFNVQGSACDQNGDSACTPADFTAWIQNFNAGC